MTFFKTIFYSFTTWILSSLICGTCCGFFLRLSGSALYEEGGMSFSILFSFVFSVPAIFIFWLYFIICIYNGKKGRELFMHILYSTFFISLASGLLLTPFLFNKETFCRWGVAVIIVASAMLTTFIHRSTYLTIFKKQEDEKSL